jgi:hypothetical protein
VEQIDKHIDDWIRPFATIIGDRIDVDLKLKKENPIKYFVRLTLPNIFQSYAIALHSFWINYNIPKEKIKEISNDDDEIPEEEFSRISWSDFYNLKNNEFELNKAISDSIEFKRFDKQLNNELYPGQGLMDKEHIESLVKIVSEIYGNQDIEAFYIFLSTNKQEKDLLFKGKIIDLPSLLKNENLRLTPSLIYPKEKNWVINSDYDLAFSMIGGETRFINELVKQNKNEIYKVDY